MRLWSTLASLVFCASPAVAGATSWQEIAPGVKARMISSDVRADDGSTLVGLQIVMPESHNTYWHIPGEAGIPTEIDFSGSKGISDQRIRWPLPRIETTKGIVDFVYRGPIILPVEVTMSGTAELDARVTLGICSDICVPVQAHFSLPLRPGDRDAGNDLRLAQALALVPVPWHEDIAPVGEISATAGGGELAVRIENEAFDPETLIASIAGKPVLFGAPQKSPETNLVHIPVLSAPRAFDLFGETVALDFLTPDGAYTLLRVVGRPTP